MQIVDTDLTYLAASHEDFKHNTQQLAAAGIKGIRIQLRL
jgi:hypothetical protein